VFDGLSGLRKDNRGYDLGQLLIGSEGTLGIITALNLQLVPAVAAWAVAWVGLADPQAGLDLLRSLQSATDRVEASRCCRGQPPPGAEPPPRHAPPSGRGTIAGMRSSS
jgi:FAD/FMN-containing dehydrogenase